MSRAGATFVEVAVPRPIDRTFLYRVPEEWASSVRPGMRALVPFGRREMIGWIDRVVDEPRRVARVRDLLDLPDEAPLFEPDLLDLCRWIARYYVAPLGLVFRAALPGALTSESHDILHWTDRESPDEELSPLETKLAAYLRSHGDARIAGVRKALGHHGWWPVARRLAEKGKVTITHEPAEPEPTLLRRTVVRLKRELPSLRERDRVFGRAQRQRELFEYLESVGGDAELAHLTDQLGFSRSVVGGLAEKALAAIEEVVRARDPFEDAPAGAGAVSLIPTEAQRSAIATILETARRPAPGTFVLQGVTGSGKTLVYIEVLKEIVLARGRSAIVLVPEIALTPQTVARFRAVFGDRIAVLHSALGEGERYDAWRALREGRKTIAVGARSAVFAPLPNLGAVVLDEEHEATYKQNEPTPRYHARDVALVRADRAGAVAVLGSATPSLETW
ncbi:MAG: DEAD/DEAH box helicase, partial [Gemmatimonadota bacterium]